MNATLQTHIQQKLAQLPDELMPEVTSFLDYLTFKLQDWPAVPIPQNGARAIQVKAAKGRFAHVPTSSVAFAQRKQAEIELEDAQP